MGLPAHAPSNTAPPANAGGNAPTSRRLKKGEVLFAEGESSNSMYFVKSGMIRIFKKKGDAPVEIETIRTGQILGELAFLDGNPRSASAEALCDCELTEISSPAFQAVMAKMPDWVKILLKTVVARLRTAGTRIRQMENTGNSIDYKEKDGRKTASYVYINTNEFLRMCSALLLVAVRTGIKTTAPAVEFKTGLLPRYANSIMQVPAAKLETFLDIMVQAQILANTNPAENKADLCDPDFLEKFIGWVTEENLLEDEKKHILSPKGFLVMSFIAKHISKFQKDAEGRMVVNLALIKQTEEGAAQKELFRYDDAEEMVKKGYCTTPNLKSTSEVFTTISPDSFLAYFKYHRILMILNATNEQKARSATVGR